MDLSRILKDKPVMDNFRRLIENHEISGELEFNDTEISLDGMKAKLNGSISIVFSKN